MTSKPTILDWRNIAVVSVAIPPPPKPKDEKHEGS